MNPIVSLVYIIFIVLLLQNCSRVGKFTFEEPVIPASFTAITEQDVQQDSVSWVKLFGDAELNRYIRLGLKKNKGVLSSYYNTQSYLAAIGIAQSALYPQINFNQENRVNHTDTRSNGNTTKNTERAFEINTAISWEIDLWDRISQEEQVAVLNLKEFEIQYQAVQLSLIANMSKNWFSMLALQERILLAQKRKEHFEIKQAFIKESVMDGTVSVSALYQVNSESLQAENKLLELQEQLENLKRAFFLMVGDFPQTQVLSKTVLPKNIPPIKPLVPSKLIKRRTDIQIARIKVDKAEKQIDIAHSRRFPSFFLTSRIGNSSHELEKMLDFDTIVLNTSGRITAPLFQAGKLKAAEKQALHFAKKTLFEYHDTLLKAFLEIDQIISENYYLRQRLKNQIMITEESKKQQTILLSEVKAGLQTVQSYLNTNNSYFDQVEKEIQLRLSLVHNQIQFYLAIGGDSNFNVSHIKDHNEKKSEN